MKNQILTPIILPTEDASHLFISSTGQLLFDKTSKVSKDNKHIHLTSDAPAPDVQYTRVYPNISTYRGKYYLHDENKVIGEILFATDPRLIDAGVMAIDGNTKVIIRVLNSSPSSYTTDGNAVIGYTDNEAYFLSEFCKRWNEKNIPYLFSKVDMDDPSTDPLSGDPDKYNQKVDVEKLALEYRKKHPLSHSDATFAFADGYNQALQSQVGGLNLPSNDKLMEMAKSRGLTKKEADVWVDGARSIKGMIYEREEAGIFSLEDMRKCWNYSGDFFNEHTANNKLELTFEEFIQSLTKSQPAEEIAIELIEGKIVFK